MGLAIRARVKVSLTDGLPKRGRDGDRGAFSVSLDLGGAAAPRKALAWGLLALLAALGGSGCVETAGDVAAGVEGSQQFVRRADASMAGATMAIVSIEGAPSELTARFDQSLDQAAAARQIALAPPTSARYLVRGYLTAAPARDGATVDFVWDVFTQDKQRAQRLSDSIVVRGSGDDPWAMVTDAALDSIAAKCADDLAAYLSNTPEAAPGAALSYAQ
jgi:hypothetical protein